MDSCEVEGEAGPLAHPKLGVNLQGSLLGTAAEELPAGKMVLAERFAAVVPSSMPKVELEAG